MRVDERLEAIAQVRAKMRALRMLGRDVSSAAAEGGGIPLGALTALVLSLNEAVEQLADLIEP